MGVAEEKYKRAKEDLVDLETYIKDFSDFLPLAVCTINPLGIIIDFNKSAEKLTGYLSIEIVGDNFKKLFPEKEYEEEIEKEIKAKKSLNKELTLINKSKKKIPVNVSVSARADSEGNYIGCFAAFFDITEIKNFRENMEKEVKQRTGELQKRIDELERLHDLTVGRELKMLELKREIKRLKARDQTRS